MPVTLLKQLKGILLIVSLPFLAIISLIIGAQNAFPLYGLSVLIMLVYLLVMANKMEYPPSFINSLDRNLFPIKIQRLLFSTNSQGYYFRIIIIRSFKHDRKLSQTELTEEVNRCGIKISQPGLIKHIRLLESADLIQNTSVLHSKRYTLTDYGKKVLNALDHLLPERYFQYVVYNEIGINGVKAKSVVLAVAPTMK